MDKIEIIRGNIQDSIDLRKSILENEHTLKKVVKITNLLIEAFRKGNKVIFCGNGGSFADAQHLSAELSGRFYYDRPPLDSEVLSANLSYLTAVSNDYSYEMVYSRMLEAIGKKGDVLFGISTSGNSKNIINAFKTAPLNGVKTVSLLGKGGGEVLNYSDFSIVVDSEDTPRIQEIHMLLGHTICQLVEASMFPKK